MNTTRPWELLPLPEPKDFDPGPAFFYKNFVNILSKDFVRIMNAGLHVDEEAVDTLRDTLDTVLNTVKNTLANNKIIQAYQAQEYPKVLEEYSKTVLASTRDVDYYLKPYDNKNIVHRTYVVNERLKTLGLKDDCKSKWTVTDLKKTNSFYGDAYLDKVINKTLSKTDTETAMLELAKDKAAIWNKVREDKVKEASPEKLLPPFNPGSSLQLRKLFEYLNVEPLAFSKETNEPSWGRAQVEEVFHATDDTDWKEFLQAFIDYSYGSIVRTNFIEAFDRFTVDGILRGNYKNFGAKSYRPTSNKPNLLNMPSTKSIYAKPLKSCFVAPEGYLVWSIDYSALEDRVIANLSKDTNKLNIFLEGLDGHSLNAVGYFPERLEPILGKNTDNTSYVKEFMRLNNEGNKDIKKIRQEGKVPTFGLAYGAYPQKIASTIKCTLPEAEAIFNNYHNVLYPGITAMRNSSLSIAKQQGYLHLGLGCRLYSDDVETNSRTLFNALSQFWSVLTLISLNELHYQIDHAELDSSIIPNSTIYDAIYGIVKDDPETIKWLNDTIVPIMEKDFMENQIVHNEARLEIGPSWAKQTELPIDASIEKIQEVLNGI